MRGQATLRISNLEIVFEYARTPGVQRRAVEGAAKRGRKQGTATAGARTPNLSKPGAAARTMSPPTAAAGNRTLIASRTVRSPKATTTRTATTLFNSDHQARPQIAIMVPRIKTTRPVLQQPRPRYAALRDSRSRAEARELPQTRKRRGLQKRGSSTGSGLFEVMIFASARPGG